MDIRDTEKYLLLREAKPSKRMKEVVTILKSIISLEKIEKVIYN